MSKKNILDYIVQIFVNLYGKVSMGVWLQLSASEYIVTSFCKKQTEIFKTAEQAQNI